MSAELRANEIISGIPELAAEMKAFHQSVKDMLTVLKQGVSTFEKQSKSQADLAKKTKATKEAVSNLTALEKERIRIASQTKKVLAQNLALEEKNAKTLLKGTLALRAKKAALVEEITGAKAAAKAQRDFNKAHSEALKINNKLNTSTKKSSASWKTLAKGVFAAGGAIGIVTAVIRKVTAAVKDAIVVNRTFEKTFANVLTLLDQATKAEFGLELEKGAIDIVANYGLAIEDVNQSLFDTISAGIPAGEAIEFLNRSAKTAIAGNAELSAVVDGATNVVGAYGDAAGSTTEILNAFFAAQVKGKTNVSLLATNIGKVASTAAAADIPLNELFGTFAGLTKFIGGTEESATSLAAIMKTIIKPTSEAERVFKDLGIETGITGLKSNGLLTTLKQVADAYEDNNDVLGDLVPNVRAFKGIAGLTAESIAEIEANILELNDTEASSILVQEAFNEQMKTQQKQAELLKGNYQRLLITIGGGENVFKKIGTAVKANLSKEINQASKNIERLGIAWDRVTRKITKEQAIEAEKQLQIRYSTDTSAIESTEKTAEELLAIEKKKAEDIAKLNKQIAEKAAAAEKERDVEVQKNIDRLKKELAAKLALEEKAKADSDALADSLVDEEEQLADAEIARLAKQINEEYKLETEAQQKILDDKKAKADEWEAARKEITSAGIDAASKIVSDRITFGIDEDLAAIKLGYETEQTLLDDKLDKGQISEEDYAKETEAIYKKTAYEQAKAAKKKAQYQNAIDGITAIAKTFAEFGWPGGIIPAAVMAGLTLTQGIAIAAEPLPKLKDGVIKAKGKTHAQGGIKAEIEKDESVISAKGTIGSTELLTAINEGRIKDADILTPNKNKVFGADSKELYINQQPNNIDLSELVKESRLTREEIRNRPEHITALSDNGLTAAYKSKEISVKIYNDWLHK